MEPHGFPIISSCLGAPNSSGNWRASVGPVHCWDFMALGPVCSNAISLRFFHVLSVIKASFPKCSMKKPNVIKQKQKRNTHLYKYIYYIYIWKSTTHPVQPTPKLHGIWLRLPNTWGRGVPTNCWWSGGRSPPSSQPSHHAHVPWGQRKSKTIFWRNTWKAMCGQKRR